MSFSSRVLCRKIKQGVTKMKSTALVLILALATITQAADIDTVNILPPNPTNTDYITIDVSGECSWCVGFDYSEWEFLDYDQIYSITLYFQYISCPQIFPPGVHSWNTTVDLGYIELGDYNLVIIPDSPDGGHYYDTQFTVTPEPCSFLLFSATALITIRRKRK